ncbi:hypothetical protein KQI42_00475 [Tissierella sp. MSJ-40]|uniref:Outer membrane efflux protein n=1 Tax=Tissierella simiarum TaxID=2841534 RepID=A0ABS6E0N6_9FIRM|nr:TolC family protein [Tissierella simiarum]MBU5436457.1 hypothetical protein [Tissierella simiarum]
MKKRQLFCFLLIIPMIFKSIPCFGINNVEYRDHEFGQGHHSIYAERTTSKKTLGELVESFKRNSSNYQQIDINYELEALNYDIYLQQLDILKDEDFIQRIELELKKNNSKYYKENKEELINDSKDIAELEFKKKCLSLLINDKRIAYSNATKKYLKSLLDIEIIKFNRGYTTKTTIDDLKTQIESISSEINYYNNINEQILADIKLETGIKDDFSIVFEYEHKKSSYDRNIVQAKLANRNNETTMIKNSIDAYEKYLIDLINLYGPEDTLVQQIELKIKSLNLDLEKSKNQIKVYAFQVVNQYNYIFDTLHAKGKALDVYNKKYLDLSKQYKKGKIPLIDVYKLSMEKENIEFEYYKLYCDLFIYDEIITKGILGQSFE